MFIRSRTKHINHSEPTIQWYQNRLGDLLEANFREKSKEIAKTFSLCSYLYHFRSFSVHLTMIVAFTEIPTWIALNCLENVSSSLTTRYYDGSGGDKGFIQGRANGCWSGSEREIINLLIRNDHTFSKAYATAYLLTILDWILSSGFRI